jgi:hypothetical protein
MALILVLVREVLALLLDGWADLRGQLAEELQALLLVSRIDLLLIFKHPVGVDLELSRIEGPVTLLCHI